MSCATVVSPIEILSADDVGRRRHWSDEDKLRIVEESLRGYRQGFCHGAPLRYFQALLSIWRREYRSGALGGSATSGGFVPLVMEGMEAAPKAERPLQRSEEVRIEITLTNGRRMTTPASLAPSRLAALLSVVDPG